MGKEIQESGSVREYEIGEFVYVVTDTEQKRRLITGILTEPNGKQYRLTVASHSDWFYAMEISRELCMITKLELK